MPRPSHPTTPITSPFVTPLLFLTHAGDTAENEISMD